MHPRRHLQLVICLGILLCILASTSTAGEYGTVISKTGVTFENVYLIVDRDLQIVTIVKGTEETNIGFGAIESITNTAGKQSSDNSDTAY